MRRRGTRNVRLAIWDFYQFKQTYHVPVYLCMFSEQNAKGFLAKIPADGNYTKDSVILDELKDDDLRRLYNKVKDYLAGLIDVNWKNYLEVTINKPSGYGTNCEFDAGVRFEVNKIQLGKDAKGKKYWRRHDKDSTSEGDNPGRSAWSGDTVSYLPDTEENRAALRLLSKELTAFEKRLRKFMSPKTIRKTLARALDNNKLLTGPAV